MSKLLKNFPFCKFLNIAVLRKPTASSTCICSTGEHPSSRWGECQTAGSQQGHEIVFTSVRCSELLKSKASCECQMTYRQKVVLIQEITTFCSSSKQRLSQSHIFSSKSLVPAVQVKGLSIQLQISFCNSNSFVFKLSFHCFIHLQHTPSERVIRVLWADVYLTWPPYSACFKRQTAVHILDAQLKSRKARGVTAIQEKCSVIGTERSTTLLDSSCLPTPPLFQNKLLNAWRNDLV